MDKKEIWLPVKGYEGLYEVSNFGNVRSLDWYGTGKTRVLKTSKSNCGYLRVTLFKNGKPKHFSVHRLVAEAFIPNLFGESQVNHIDEDKTNNHAYNLEWCDAKYNNNYGNRINLQIEKQKNGKLSKPVLQYTKKGEFVREWPSTMECARNGFHQGHVASCCRGEEKYHKGYIWRYKEVS